MRRWRAVKRVVAAASNVCGADVDALLSMTIPP